MCTTVVISDEKDREIKKKKLSRDMEYLKQYLCYIRNKKMQQKKITKKIEK